MGLDCLGAKFRNTDESYVEDRRGAWSWLEDSHLKSFRAAAVVVGGLSVFAAGFVLSKLVR